MTWTGWVGSVLLVAAVAAAGGAVVSWRNAAQDAAPQAAYEPQEAVTAAVAQERIHRRTTTAIGTVLALRSITLRNEIAGTVQEVNLVPGKVVEPGAVLVTLDVSVEEAELKALEAQEKLAETVLERMEKAVATRAASEVDVERARAERDVAKARIARTRAVIARKTLRAPFKAVVGLSNVHTGQYLSEGVELTTLQGVAEEAHVDFQVPQPVAAALAPGEIVRVVPAAGAAPLEAELVAVDARVDPSTRNAKVRAKMATRQGRPTPGSSVRVLVPVGEPIRAVAVPVTALRKGPSGDHVFVLAAAADGKTRAQLRRVDVAAMLGDEVLLASGVKTGEQVAASGSFKLRDGAGVAIAPAGTE